MNNRGGGPDQPMAGGGGQPATQAGGQGLGSTKLMASITLLLPLPLGPTTAVKSAKGPTQAFASGTRGGGSLLIHFARHCKKATTPPGLGWVNPNPDPNPDPLTGKKNPASTGA